MPRVEVAGTSVAYLEQGSGEPVILLHSSGASSAQWQALIERLGPRYRVIAPDLYGYGATPNWPGGGPFSLRREAGIVRALLEDCDEPVHLVGHSYGGAVALHLACEHGDLLRSLTLVEPVAFHVLRAGDADDAEALGEITAVAGGIGQALACGDYLAGMGDFVDYWCGSGTWRAFAPDKQAAMATHLAKVALDFHATFHEPGCLSGVQHIAVPTLLVQGECTPLPTRRVCRRLARSLPGVRMETIPQAGHMAPLTHRHAVNELIAFHLDGCGKQPPRLEASAASKTWKPHAGMSR
jgi:pimeloyl-ACP methyl ester carboxylesterase